MVLVSHFEELVAALRLVQFAGHFLQQCAQLLALLKSALELLKQTVAFFFKFLDLRQLLGQHLIVLV